MMNDLKKIIKEAGRIAMRYYGRLKASDIEYKGPVDLVTRADRTIEDFLKEKLSRHFPHAGFLCEESCAPADSGGPHFIIDPLDGTTNFVHDYPCFSISLAYAEGKENRLGLVYLPYFDHLYWAEKGKGAFCNKKRIRVSKRNRLIDSLLVTGFACVRGRVKPDNVGFFSKIIYRTQEIRRDGSAAIDLCWVAHGKFDLFWELNLNAWDVAAGSLIVEEAGGRVTDFRDGKDYVAKRQIMASNGLVHAEFLQCIRQYRKKDQE